MACALVLGSLASWGVELKGLIRDVVGLGLLLTALAMLAPALGRRLGGQSGESADPRPVAGLTVMLGALLGLVVTLSSIGSGAICAALLIWLYPRLPVLSVVGTDLAHAVPLLGVALLGHWTLGHVDFLLLASLLPGAAPGVWLGTRLGARIPDHALRHVLAVVLLLLGGKMIVA